MIINGDGGYGFLAASAYIGGPVAQASWPPGAVSVFIAWTEWTLAVALLRWQHYKYHRGYYYYYYYYNLNGSWLAWANGVPVHYAATLMNNWIRGAACRHTTTSPISHTGLHPIVHKLLLTNTYYCILTNYAKVLWLLWVGWWEQHPACKRYYTATTVAKNLFFWGMGPTTENAKWGS